MSPQPVTNTTRTGRSGFADNIASMPPRRRWMLGAALAAALIALVVFVVATKRRAVTDASTGGTSTPSRASDKGGTKGAPGMEGMNGVGVTANGSVKLTAAQIRLFGITFGTAAVRALTTETRATGVITFDETRVSQVTAKIGGVVERLYVNATGQQVRRGQPLFDIYSPDLVATQQELLLAGQLQRDIGKSAIPGVSGTPGDLVAATRRRLQLWDISNGQIDEILRTGRARRTLTLFAPASGVVVEKKVLQGQAIMPGEVLYTVANLTVVWVDVQLREAEGAVVRPGSSVDLEITGLPGHAFKGRVAYVYPTLDSASRSLRARVVVPNGDQILKPGMYATVRLSTPSRSVLTVPSTAVLQTGDRNVVFVDMDNGELVPRDVELGRRAGEYMEIISGLEPGERVVTSAQFLLDSESNLGEVMKSMVVQGGASQKASAGATGDMPGMTMPSGKTTRPPSSVSPR